MNTADELWPQLEAVGEDAVRQRLAEGAYHLTRKKPLVRQWLAMKDAQRAEVREREQQASAQEVLRVAQDGNAIAAGSNRIAWFAIIVALVSVLAAWVHH